MSLHITRGHIVTTSNKQQGSLGELFYCTTIPHTSGSLK